MSNITKTRDLMPKQLTACQSGGWMPPWEAKVKDYTVI